MDRTDFLAARAFTEDTRDRPATQAEIDAFYDDHGPEVFARAFRLRRWLRSRAAALGKRSGATPGFARMARNR